MRANVKGSIIRPTAAESRVAPEEPVNALNLYEAELAKLMLPVAITGSVFNALANEINVAGDSDELIAFLPAQSLSACEISGMILTAPIEQDLCTEVLGVSYQLYHCMELAKAYADRSFGDEVGAAPVAHAWRRLAESCLVANRMFARAIGARGTNDAHESNHTQSEILLEAVSAGLSPCVDENGNIVMPAVEERRVHERTADAGIPVEICAGGQWRPATILDISPQGIGLSGSTAVRVGEVISIEFAPDVSVLCTIRWSMDNRFGVSISGSLQSSLIDALRSRLDLARASDLAEQQSRNDMSLPFAAGQASP